MERSGLGCEAFDPFSLPEDFRAASEADVSWGEIAQALVIAAIVIVLDEGGDLRLQLSWKILVLQADSVLERLMPALDFALRLRMARRAADMIHVVIAEPCCQIARDVGRAIVREQPRPMDNVDLIQTGGLQHQFQRLCDILGLHRRAELPGDDVA